MIGTNDFSAVTALIRVDDLLDDFKGCGMEFQAGNCPFANLHHGTAAFAMGLLL